MSLPTTTCAYRRNADSTDIELVTDTLPESLKPNDILLKVNAVSLNYRDIAMLHNAYPVPTIPHGIMCSDASCTVLATGSAVTSFAVGDHVTPAFRHDSADGTVRIAPGGDIDGVLADHVILDERFVAHAPKHLSHEQVATIPCAGVTAWNALMLGKSASKAIKTVLLEGTGGVSMFAVLLCLAAGITPIITSSSDVKLDAAKSLGQSVLGVNYKTHPDWENEVLRLTDGKGVDLVVNNVGSSSIEKNFVVLKPFGGVVSMVGFLGGMVEKENRVDVPMLVLYKNAIVQ
jgi:NADPH:quinone reductase-like Zn-dependent oxidoreductase